MKPLDPGLFREAMSRFASGVTVVTASRGDRRFGITASSFVSVSAEPPLVLVCLAKSLYTRSVIEESQAFAVSILGVHQLDVGLRFAGMKPELGDRFRGLASSTAVTGAPLLDGSLATLDCRLWQTHEGGDHTIFVGEVVHAAVSTDNAPLLYHNRLWRRSGAIAPNDAPIRVHLIEETAEGLAKNGVALLGDAFDASADPQDGDSAMAVLNGAVGRGSRGLCLQDLRGAASPSSVDRVVRKILAVADGAPVAVALSDAHGFGLANILSAFHAGVDHFVTGSDSNTEEFVATGEVATLFREMGVECSILDRWRPGADETTDPEDHKA